MACAGGLAHPRSMPRGRGVCSVRFRWCQSMSVGGSVLVISAREKSLQYSHRSRLGLVVASFQRSPGGAGIRSHAELFTESVGKAVKGPQIFFWMLCTASLSSAASGRRLLSSTTSGLMHLWTTPVLAAKPVAASDDAFLDRLSAHGVDAHHRFAQALAAEEIEVAADDFDDLNGAFYKWQQDQHDSDEPSELYASLVSSSEFTTLRGLIADAAVRYIEAADVEVGIVDLEIFAWAAILRAGESHMPHAHPSSLISGVFWSRVTENAGPLLLDDPRGPLPPFVHKVPVEPVAGELVMFPSWLQHQVLPRHFEGERVSWSFNISDPSSLAFWGTRYSGLRHVI